MRSEKGFSLAELAFVAGLIATVTAVAVPQLLAGLDEWRTRGAARYLSARLYRTRMEAVVRTAATAMRFVRVGPSYGYTVYLDGNRNGVRSADIQGGVDSEIERLEQLSDQFPGVDFGTLPGLPPVDPAAPPPGDDPVRFGASDIVTFTAIGSSSSGSIYIRGRRDAQYVVRVFGTTGKIRILKFNPRTRQWTLL